MIYHFPDLDTLRLAITSAVVPPEITLAPAIAGQDDDGHLWLQPSIALSRKTQNGLRKLGVEIVKANGDLQAEQITCWLQMLPVVRDNTAPVPSPTTPVLFELTDASQLPDLVGEMLRLGNDRQSFRWFKDDTGNRVLLRVVGPPYYSLLRALERHDPGKAPVAYLERVPRVWVEMGHTHPLVEHFKAAEGRLLLMRPPHEWTFLDDAPFQDIYDLLEFTLPQAAVRGKEAKARSRIQVPLRLAPSGSTEAAELWVLREDAIDQLDTLVREADDRELQRLAFAVAEHDGKTVIVVRVRPSKQAPPALELKGRSFRPFSKMPNLFLPSQLRLQPPLRRDVVRELLAPDPDLIVWLWPNGDGTFTPETLPDASFRPLPDWVDYILDREQQALLTWIQSARFDFQSFICADDDRPADPKPPARERKGGGKGSRDDQTAPETEAPPAPAAAKKQRRRETTEEFAVLPQAKPSELAIQLHALERQFLDHDGPLDAQERLTLWPEMAKFNTALNHPEDAAVCWQNALWESETPPRDWTALWLHAEKLPGGEVTGAMVDRLLAISDPAVSDVRSLVACIVAAVAQGNAAQVLGPRLPRIRQFLEKRESSVGVRAMWLAWVSLARLSAGDVLGLARRRDRVLERLLTEGLSSEKDLPSFLRFAGQQSSDRFRAVREHVSRLHELALKWIDQCYEKEPASNQGTAGREPTKAYADLIFAFGLARLGEASGARKLQAQAQEVLGGADEVHDFLLQAYTYRIQQVLEGKPHGGPLPPEFAEDLLRIGARLGSDGKNVGNFDVYKIDRLRCRSRILEPQEKVDAFRYMLARDDLSKELLAISESSDRQEMAARLGKRLQQEKQQRPLMQVLKTSLELAPRISETFTLDVLDRLAKLLDALAPVTDARELEERAALVERALFLAAHFDRAEHVQTLVARFLQLVESQRGAGAAQALDGLTGQCFRGLRKLGLRDETDRLLQQMAALVMQGKDVATLSHKHGKDWPTVLRTLLQIAAGWLYFGRNEKAMPILAEGHRCLYDEELLVPERTKLACAFAATLGQAPVDLALHKLTEMFQKLGVLTDTFTTNTHYSRSQLEVVEAVVLSVVSDDFALTQGVRRWLDEDEYLVRRRIHSDLRALMHQSGL